MNGVIKIIGVLGEIEQDGKIITPNTTFTDVATQIESQKECQSFDVYIDSPGGYIETGKDIIAALENLKKQGKAVNTIAENECASMATEVFLRGEKRTVRPEIDFMIHNPMISEISNVDADTLEAYSKGVRKLENNMIASYSKHTGTSKETLKTLMKNETHLTAEQAVELGFATHIEEKMQLNAVAFSQQFKQKNKKEMAENVLTKKEAEGLVENLLEKAKNFLTGAKAMKTIQDGNGDDIVFPDLEEDENPKVGDKATIDGSPANESRVMPNGETYVFESGELTEIKETEDDNEVEDLKEEIENLKTELTQAKAQSEKFEKEIETKSLAIKDIEKDLKVVKRSISSNFNFKDPQKPEPEKQKNRKL